MLKRLAVAVALGSALPLVFTAPASASDLTLKVHIWLGGNQHEIARTSWDDLTDTLCVKAFGGETGYAEAWFVRPNGTTLRIKDVAGWHTSNTCTGNLSIQEDFQTRLYLRWNPTPSGMPTQTSGLFYT